MSEGIPRPIIVPGERVYLSHPRRSDLSEFARWFADLELTTYLGQVGTAFMPEHEDDWYDSVVRDTHKRTFAIMLRDGDRPIGSTSLFNWDRRAGVAEVGIAIGDKAAWGRGYGSEALRLMVAYGFTFLELHTIYLWHVQFNERGHHAYRKAGFREAGRIRGGCVFNGTRYDNVLMDIVRTDIDTAALAAMIKQLPPK